ncbi:MAG: hypothetical protein M1827_004844 [Pycnora praestabilis]|nr:MAG: hypothetical protein M1827_004844 [Pycnora praestabilis]
MSLRWHRNPAFHPRHPRFNHHHQQQQPLPAPSPPLPSVRLSSSNDDEANLLLSFSHVARLEQEKLHLAATQLLSLHRLAEIQRAASTMMTMMLEENAGQKLGTRMEKRRYVVRGDGDEDAGRDVSSPSSDDGEEDAIDGREEEDEDEDSAMLDAHPPFPPPPPLASPPPPPSSPPTKSHVILAAKKDKRAAAPRKAKKTAELPPPKPPKPPKPAKEMRSAMLTLIEEKLTKTMSGRVVKKTKKW